MLGRMASSAGLLGRLAAQLTGSGAAGAAGAALQHAAAATGHAAQQWGAAARQPPRAGFATNSHDIFNVHKDSPENNPNVPFDFTPANYKRVRGAARSQPSDAGAARAGAAGPRC